MPSPKSPKKSLLALRTPLLEQFRDFEHDNRHSTPEHSLEYFAVFGGLNVPVSTELSLDEAIETCILDDYAQWHHTISELTHGDKECHALLSGIALSDSREHAAYKRAGLSRQNGERARDAMMEAGLIVRETARPNSRSWLNDDVISDRLHFTVPFLRFWFAFVSPIFKGIKEGNYGEFKERYANHAAGFADPVFAALGMELLKQEFRDDPIAEIGGYWDSNVDIDIIAKTASGKTVAGSCRYVNAKLKKSELSKLQEKCERAGFKPDVFVLIAKNGFSGELKSLKGEGVRLFSLKHFGKLVQGSQGR